MSRKFEIDWENGWYRCGKYLVSAGGKLIVCVEVSNELYVLDKEAGSIRRHTYNSGLTATGKKGNHPSRVSGGGEFSEVSKKIREEISFLAPVWDEVNEVFYRFSYFMEFDETEQSTVGSHYQQESGTKIFLTAYDKDLNMLAESAFPQMTKPPTRHFAKDGKLWIFENIGDEMGFVRLRVNL